jgi:hypothetical protein
MIKDCMLSTVDNPYDPFEQFNLWLMFDKEKGYDSCERLARLVNLTDDMTQKEIDEETERAIDELIKLDFTDTFIKVYKESTDTE